MLGRRSILAGALAVGATGGLAGCGRAPRDDDGTTPRSPTTPPTPSHLRLLSYNVLADPVAVEQRIPALLRTIAAAQPDVLALQEVAPWFLAWLEGAKWFAGFELARIAGDVARPNGQVIASRLPIRTSRFVALPGDQARTLLISELELDARARVVVATTHMESFLEDGSIRAAQLDRIFAELAPAGRDPSVAATVFAGDLNFGDGEQPETAHLDPGFVDAWTHLRPGEPGFTWDIEASEMARRGSFVGEPSRRLDRILIRSREWAPRSIAIVGDRPVEPGRRELFPSDHFGLLAELGVELESPQPRE